MQQTANKSPSRAVTKKEAPPRRAHAPRSNSTLSSKEVDFQNWKRRKNYDPMKAAAEGRKKVNDKKNDKTNTSGAHSTSERSPRWVKPVYVDITLGLYVSVSIGRLI